MTCRCPRTGEQRKKQWFYLLRPLVELRGFEPLTSSVQRRRSPN